MAEANAKFPTGKAVRGQTEGIFHEPDSASEIPNEATAAAIEEGRKLMDDPRAPRYSDLDALKAALDA